jgi:hypothetical protein
MSIGVGQSLAQEEIAPKEIEVGPLRQAVTVDEQYQALP